MDRVWDLEDRSFDPGHVGEVVADRGGAGRDVCRLAAWPATAPPPGRAPVVIVEDDAPVRDALRTVLELDGHAVTAFESAEALFRSGRLDERACLVLDVNLPGISGLKALEHLREAGSRVAAIVISARASDEMRLEAKRLDALDLLDKPIDLDRLGAALERIRANPGKVGTGFPSGFAKEES